MELNGQFIKDVNSTSLLSTGLNATSGDKLQSWTIFTNTIDDVTSIGLINPPHLSSNVQGPIRYELHDTFHNVIEASGDYVGQIVPVNAEDIEKIVITTNSTTRNGQPPDNLKLVINGCLHEGAVSYKPQIEATTTTPSK